MWENKPFSEKGDVFYKSHKVLQIESLEVQVMGQNWGDLKYIDTKEK